MTTRYHPRPGDTLEHGAYRIIIDDVDDHTVCYRRFYVTDPVTEESTRTMGLAEFVGCVKRDQPVVTREGNVI